MIPELQRLSPLVTINDIHKYLPQAEPFIMVDCIYQCSTEKAVTGFCIRENNPLLNTDGGFSEAGLIEHMAQSIAAKAGFEAKEKNGPIKTGFIAQLKNIKIFGLPTIKDELTTEVVVVNQLFNTLLLNANTYLNNSLIASGELRIFIEE